jgi:iron(III) transport system permease protein
LGQSWNVLGLGGLWGVQTIAYFPFAYQLIADVLARSDPRMEQAARNLGAGPWQVFRTVTLPLARPGLASAILITAIYILEDFGNPALIAGRFTVLPTQAYGLVSGFGDFVGAAAVSTILLVLALGLYVGHLRLEGNRSFVTVSGKASSMPRPPVPHLVTWCSFAICTILSGIILLVYVVLVLSAVTKAFPANWTFTLEHFDYVRVTRCRCGTPGLWLRRRYFVFAVFRAAGVPDPAQGMARSAGLLTLAIMPAAVRHLFRHRICDSL